MNKCRMCGRAFRAFSPDGNRDVRSLTLVRVDPLGYFCTMRCAAMRGVVAVAVDNKASSTQGGKA